MSIFQIIAIAAAIFCICSLLVHFIRIIELGQPNDRSEKSGDTTKGIIYANTKAMMPMNKESAYLHLPSYATGMLFHIGTFCGFLVWLLSFFPFFRQWIIGASWGNLLIAAIFGVTCICGYLLLIKRAGSKGLASFSNPDDYLSNAFTSTFQLMTALFLCLPGSKAMVAIYYIMSAILFLYLPMGKLRHVVYYFAARYHLGFFYGWRNVWPPKED